MYIVGCSSSRQMVDSTSAKLKDVKMSEVYEGLIFIEHELFYMLKHQLFYMPNWIDVDLFWMCVSIQSYKAAGFRLLDAPGCV